jgi:hypothetical protein
MSELVIKGATPETTLVDAIYVAAEELDTWECYAHGDRYHFALGNGWSIALSSDSAGRIRCETCRLTRSVSTMWALAHRPDRLAGLVRRMSAVSEPV